MLVHYGRMRAYDESQSKADMYNIGVGVSVVTRANSLRFCFI